MQRIRILIADDHAILRAGLRMLVNAQPDMEVVGEVPNSRDAVRKTVETQPDVVLMDITMPEVSGIKVIETIRQQCPKSHVLVLTIHEDPAYVRAALAGGASGFVTKRAADTDLLKAIRAIHHGETFVDPSLGARVVQQTVRGKARGARLAKEGPVCTLSDREREVLALLAHGYTNQEVANQLLLSVKTVETYRARLARKLGLHTRADIVRYAMEMGIARFHPDQTPPQK